MEKKTLEECFYQIRNGANIKQGVLDGGYPITRIETTTYGRFNRDKMGYAGITDLSKYESYVLEDGDLLMSHINSVQYLGRTVLYEKKDAEEKIIHGMNLLSLKANKDVIKPEYARYYFCSSSFKKQITRIAKKSVNQASFTVADLKKLVVDVPPLSEQMKIAEILDCVNEVIFTRRQELQKLDDLVKARFVELFGNTDKKIPVRELCDVTGGYSFKSGDISNDGAIKILQIGNVYLDNVNWETTNYLPKGYDERYSKFLLNEGDIVVALTRPIIQSLGNVKACIVKSCDLPCLLNQRVGRIVPKEDKRVLFEFIYGCLMTDDFTRYVESCSIGCSQPNISTKDIENYLIPSATYKGQKTYVEFMRQTDKSKVAVQKSLDRLQILFDKLMQEYFG